MPNAVQTQLSDLLEVLGELDSRVGPLLVFIQHKLNRHRGQVRLSGEASVQDVDVGLEAGVQIVDNQFAQIVQRLDLGQNHLILDH